VVSAQRVACYADEALFVLSVHEGKRRFHMSCYLDDRQRLPVNSSACLIPNQRMNPVVHVL